MLTTKQLLVLSLIMGAPCCKNHSYPRSLFDDMRTHMQQMINWFDQMEQQFDQRLASPQMNQGAQITMEENKTANTVEIVIAPLAIADSLDACMDHDTNALTINSNAASVNLHVRHNLLSVQLNQSIKNEADQTGKGAATYTNYAQTTQLLRHEVVLEETGIEYDAVTKKLLISVPYRKKAVSKIPVTIKEAATKSEQK